MMPLSLSRTSLIGREKESERLLEERKRLEKPNAPSQITLVHGKSGTGKTALVECLQQQTTKHPGYFLRGKFDQYQDYASPYSALVQAFDSLAQAVLSKNLSTDVADFRECLLYEGKLLVQLVPTFSKFVDSTNGQADNDDEDNNMSSNGLVETAAFLASERLAVAFRAFLRSFCTFTRPLVLFVDDLQWADKNSLDVVISLMNDNEAENLMIVGGFRDDGDNKVTLESLLERLHHRPVLDIHNGNLDLDSLNQLVAQVLSTSTDQTVKLTEMIHAKTLGNPYFCLQFLELLQRQGLLSYNFALDKWEWDGKKIKAETDVSANVADVILQRIEHLLSDVVRRILKLAACIGFYVDVDILKTLESVVEITRLVSSPDMGSRTSLSFEEALEEVDKEGFVEREGRFLKFSHDRVRQTAYELIPEGKSRDRLHWTLGQAIQRLFCHSGSGTRYIFLAADQLNRGSSCIETEEERLNLIRLNLEACKAAQRKSAVELVADFLQKAIDVCKETDWEDSYDLVLGIYSMSADIESSRGNFDLGNQAVEVVLKNVKCPEDGVQARTARIQALGWSMRVAEAVEELRIALMLCGVRLPPTNSFRLKQELRKVWKLQKGMSDDDLLKLPAMTDPLKRQAMQLLKFGVPFGFSTDERFASLCLLRMFELTLRYGHCKDTGGYAFAGYGFALYNMPGNESEAFRYSQLGLKVASPRASLPATFVVVYCYLAHLRRPSSPGLEPLLAAYRVGLETGDVSFGSICIAIYADLYKGSGLPLLPYIDDLKKFVGQLKVCKQDFLSAHMIPNLQLALNLSDQSKDPITISWPIVKELGLLNDYFEVDDNVPAKLMIDYNQAFNAYILNNHDIVEKAIDQMLVRKVKRYNATHFVNYFFNVVDGLAGLLLYAKHKKRKHKKLAADAIKWLERSSTAGSVDCAVFVKLLKAVKTSKKSGLGTEEIKAKFDDGIRELARTGFLHYGAIANERMGEYMLHEAGDKYWAEHYLTRSARLYSEWGASVKVKQLVQNYSFINMSGPDKVGSALRGRARYNSIVDSVDAAPQKALKHVSGVVDS